FYRNKHPPLLLLGLDKLSHTPPPALPAGSRNAPNCTWRSWPWTSSHPLATLGPRFEARMRPCRSPYTQASRDPLPGVRLPSSTRKMESKAAFLLSEIRCTCEAGLSPERRIESPRTQRGPTPLPEPGPHRNPRPEPNSPRSERNSGRFGKCDGTLPIRGQSPEWAESRSILESSWPRSFSRNPSLLER